jgi:hypothetical protein
MRCGVGALSNSTLVTSFTLPSVVCADSTTAHSNEKLSKWLRGIGGAGYRWLRTFMMRMIFVAAAVMMVVVRRFGVGVGRGCVDQSTVLRDVAVALL